MKKNFIFLVGAFALSPFLEVWAGNKNVPPVYVDLSQKWVSAPWMPDVKAQKVRAGVDALIKQKKIEDVWRYYQQKAQYDNSDLYAQFAWTYASFLAADGGVKNAKVDVVRGDVFLRKQNLPYSYEYGRLRFLVETQMFPHPFLEAAGRRLVKHDPKDYDVRYYFVKTLHPGTSAAARAEAIQMVESLQQLAPQRANAYAATGRVYFLCYVKSKKAGDAQKAIAAYQKFLNLAPPNDKFRPQAQSMIDLIHNWMLRKNRTENL